MEYSGWNLYDNVTIVIRPYNHREYNLPQAYIVDPKNKKQFESAIHWGEERRYNRIEGTANYEYVTTDPIIKTVKNEGFEIELIDAANESYQGGKLSFWNCLVTHDKEDIKCVVGINADILLTLLLQNTFINGKCNNKVRFARKQGNVGVISDNMKEYTEALKDMQSKKDVTKKKTSKWEVGKSYITLTLDETFLGKLYKPFNIEYNYSGGSYWSRDRLWEIKYEDKPCKTVLIDSSKVKEFKSLSEMLNKYKEIIDNNFNNIVSKVNDSSKKITHVSLSDLTYDVSILNYWFHKDLPKFPARQQGEFSIEVDMDINSFYKELIEYIQDKTIELHSKIGILNTYQIDSLIIRTSEFDDESLTDKEKKLIDLFLNSSEKNEKVKSLIKYKGDN